MSSKPSVRSGNRSRRAIAAALGAFAFLCAAGPATAANYSHPATYAGSAATGGSVEFDVSADGSAVTRFVVTEVPTSCGTISSTTTGSIPIAGEAFSFGSSTGTGTRVEGSFPAAQQAQGTLSFRISAFPISCTSENVSWTARTSTPPPDTTPPQTKISAGPSGSTSSHKAKFRFGADEPGSTFQCKLDAKKWAACSSPKTYKGLEEGKHTFRVKATDAAGNADPSPAKRSWRVT